MSKEAATDLKKEVASEKPESKDQPQAPRPEVIDWVVDNMRRGLATKN